MFYDFYVYEDKILELIANTCILCETKHSYAMKRKLYYFSGNTVQSMEQEYIPELKENENRQDMISDLNLKFMAPNFLISNNSFSSFRS